MEKVIDLAHFSELVKNVRQSDKKTLSNCYLLPDAIERYTHRQHMFWQNNANGVCFLCRESDFYHLYFYLAEPILQDDFFRFREVEKPIVLDMVIRAGELSKSQVQLEQYWSSCGFRLYKQYSHYVLVFPEGDRRELYNNELDSRRFELGTIDLEEIQRVQHLWRTNLDPYSMALPAGEDLEAMVQRKQVLCIRTKDGIVAGVTRPEIQGKTATNWNLVVDPQFRGQGLATILMTTIYIQHPEVERMYAWMDDENTHIIKIHLADGYKPDGKIDRQFLHTQ